MQHEGVATMTVTDRPLRADAQRNREKLLAAATEGAGPGARTGACDGFSAGGAAAVCGGAARTARLTIALPATSDS